MNRYQILLIDGLTNGESGDEQIEYKNKRCYVLITYRFLEDRICYGFELHQVGSNLGWCSLNSTGLSEQYGEFAKDKNEMIDAVLAQFVNTCNNSFERYPRTQRYKKYLDEVIAFFNAEKTQTTQLELFQS